MTVPSSWPELHDATLVRIALDWERGTADVELRLGGNDEGLWMLSAHGVRKLECPREQPWGPSVSVNQARTLRVPQGAGARLELEIQTGDTLVIDADEFTMERRPDSA